MLKAASAPPSPPTPAHCFLVRVGTGRRNSLEIEEGPWDPGPKVSATSVLRFQVAHHISPRLPDQRSDMLASPSQRSVLELWNFSLKPASYVDVSETRPHPQAYKTQVKCMTKMGSKAETLREPHLGPRPCSVDALCHLSDTQSVCYPNRHMQAFQKPPERHSVPSSDFIARFLASAVWCLGQGRCVLIPGLLLYPRSPSSSFSPWLCTSISLCHWQFYPEPQCSGPSVLRELTMVHLDRWNAGGTAGEIQHFSPGGAQHLDLGSPG